MRPVYGEPVPRSTTNRTRVRSINTEIALLYSDNMKARKRSVLSSRRSHFAVEPRALCTLAQIFLHENFNSTRGQ
jgi:hypothetical protein